MKFCGKCGAEIKPGQKFCPSCGNNLESKDNIEKEGEFDNTRPLDVEPALNYNSPVRKSTLSKNAKIGIIALIAVAVFLTIFIVTGKSMTKPSKVVERFQKDVTADNEKDLINILYCSDSRLEINEKNIAPLLAYFKDNSSYLNEVMKQLNGKAVQLEKLKEMSLLNVDNSNSILSIAYTGKKFLFFPNYKISVRPAFIQVKTGIKDVSFSLNNTGIGKSDSDNFSKEYGPYMPGKYKLSANYKGKYLSLNEPYDLDLVSAEGGKTSVDVLTHVNYIRVESDYSDAEIFVNGRDTGVKADGALNFGPLSSGTKVYGTIKKDGKTLKSDEYSVEDGESSIYLSFQNAESQISDTEGKLNDLMNWYTYYFTQAVNYNDFSIVAPYLYPGSKLYNDQQKYIPTTYEKGISETIMSYRITSYNLNEDNTAGTLTTEEVYNIYSNGESSVKTYNYKYTFKYNQLNGSYQLESIAKN